MPFVSLKVGEFLLAFLNSVMNEKEEQELDRNEDLREANAAIVHKINVVCLHYSSSPFLFFLFFFLFL
jgi:hypothetical protein